MSGALHSMTGFARPAVISQRGWRRRCGWRRSTPASSRSSCARRALRQLPNSAGDRAVLAERLARGRVVATVELRCGRRAAGRRSAGRPHRSGRLARCPPAGSSSRRSSCATCSPCRLCRGGETALDEGERARCSSWSPPRATRLPRLAGPRQRRCAAARRRDRAPGRVRRRLRATGGTLRELLLDRLRERLAALLEGGGWPRNGWSRGGAARERADTGRGGERLDAHLAHLRRLLDGGGPRSARSSTSCSRAAP